jgi:hypothetical protein
MDNAAETDWAEPALMRLITAYWLPQALAVVAELGLADLLEARPLTSEELAAATACDASTLARLMQALADIGLFACDSRQYYRLTTLSDRLRTGHPKSLRETAIIKCERDYRAWQHLLTTVRTGSSGYEIAFSRPFYDDSPGAHDGWDETFDASMAELSASLVCDAAHVFAAHDVTTLVDVGAGIGSFVLGVVERLPALRAVLLERPVTARLARARVAASERASQIAVIASDFFQPLPIHAGALSLVRVLHNWDDRRASIILRHCAAALQVHGLLFVIDTVREVDRHPMGSFADLNMAVLTGGKVRTCAEYESLSRSAGLELIETRSCGSRYRMMVFRQSSANSARGVGTY